jgi:hypothetical protein
VVLGVVGGKREAGQRQKRRRREEKDLSRHSVQGGRARRVSPAPFLGKKRVIERSIAKGTRGAVAPFPPRR